MTKFRDVPTSQILVRAMSDRIRYGMPDDELEAEIDRRFPVQPAVLATYNRDGSFKMEPAPVSGWQPTTMAPVGERVLVWHEGKMEIAEYREGWWWLKFPSHSFMRHSEPTHWHPLPEVPR